MVRKKRKKRRLNKKAQVNVAAEEKPAKPAESTHIYKGTKKPLIIGIASLVVVALLAVLLLFSGKFVGKAVAGISTPGMAAVMIDRTNEPFEGDELVPVDVYVTPFPDGDVQREVYGFDIEMNYPETYIPGTAHSFTPIVHIPAAEGSPTPLDNWQVEWREVAAGTLGFRGYATDFTPITGRFILKGIELVTYPFVDRAGGEFALQKVHLTDVDPDTYIDPETFSSDASKEDLGQGLMSEQAAIIIESPTNGQEVVGSVSLQFRIRGFEVGAAHAVVINDGEPIPLADDIRPDTLTFAEGVYTYTLTGLSEGNNDVTVQLVGRAGAELTPVADVLPGRVSFVVAAGVGGLCLPIGDVDTYEAGAGVLNADDVFSLQYVLQILALHPEAGCGGDGEPACDDFADDGYYICKNGIILSEGDTTC